MRQCLLADTRCSMYTLCCHGTTGSRLVHRGLSPTVFDPHISSLSPATVAHFFLKDSTTRGQQIVPYVAGGCRKAATLYNRGTQTCKANSAKQTKVSRQKGYKKMKREKGYGKRTNRNTKNPQERYQHSPTHALALLQLQEGHCQPLVELGLGH